MTIRVGFETQYRLPFAAAAQPAGTATPRAPSFERTSGNAPIIILGPHNGCEVPDELKDENGNPLGLSVAYFDPDSPEARHEAFDIGAQALFENVYETLARSGTECHYLSANYSRLVVDLNRKSEYAISPDMSETGTPIPGNINLTEQEKAERIKTFYDPYYNALRKTVDAACAAHGGAVILDLHSFTPTWNGAKRPMQLGSLTSRSGCPLADILDPHLRDACDKSGWLYQPDSPYKIPGSALQDTHATDNLCKKSGVHYQGFECRNDVLQDPGARKKNG